MKELTFPEFIDRTMAIQRAMHIFKDMTGNNVTNAFIAYQEIFAEREREIFISQASFGLDTKRIDNKYDIVRCPECEWQMLYRDLPVNDEGYKIQWVCTNSECDTVLNSENDITWWMEKLKNTEGSNVYRSKRTLKKLEAKQQKG